MVVECNELIIVIDTVKDPNFGKEGGGKM